MPNQAAATIPNFRTMNVGGIDRAARMIIGGVLCLITTTSDAIGLWGLIGTIPLVTGFMCYCPLYSLLGINTRRTTA
ncbi:MAG TPA: DUF2892 domain-containing protein [Candidatus Acidoferrum sp.]|nr:DUF2892 domain-containing protein [Candidatus Acidoferrum sp.]